MSAGRTLHVILVICFWLLVISFFVWQRVRARRDAKESAAERQALVDRLLRPDWKFYEQHLQRPAPAALRELFADRNLVTTCGLAYANNSALSTFNPLDKDSLLDTADHISCDIIPFATSDCGDAVFLRPGAHESDAVYIAHHDDPGRVEVLSTSVSAMLEALRKATPVQTTTEPARGILARMEEVLGGLLALIIAVSAMITSVLFGLERRPDRILDAVWRYGIVGVICLLEFLHVCALSQARGRSPYAPVVALSLPRLPLLFRLPVAAFWLVHLLFACGFLWAAHAGLATSSFPVQLLLTVLAAGLSYLAFGYLLNAVATVKPDPTVISRLWSRRLWYAGAIAVVAMLLPLTGFVRKVQPSDGIGGQPDGAPKAALPHRRPPR